MQTGCEKETEIFAKKQSFTRLARYDLKLKILLMENTRNRYFISSISMLIDSKSSFCYHNI